MGSFGKFFTLYWPSKTWLHRSESELLKMHALLRWAIALSDVRTLFLTIRSSLYTHFLSLRKSQITHRFWAFAQLIRAMCPALAKTVTFWYQVRIRIRGSVPLTNGSGSCYFRTWPSRSQTIFLKVLLLITFWRYIYILVLDKKS